MLPSNMNLKIKTGTVGTITLIWGKTKMLTTPAIKNHKTNSNS